MIQFNLKRFGKLACWTFRNDKRYIVKSFLQAFVILLLIFLFFTMIVKVNGGYDASYKSCTIAVIAILGVNIVLVIAILGVNIVLGPALMFYSMEGKHDMQTLMMLPASNFEKYLVRNAQCIVLVPLYIVAILGADLIQYLIHLMAGHDYGRFVVGVLFDLCSKGLPHFDGSYGRFFATLIVFIIWLQSVFAVGATLFRTRKFNWIITTVFLILLCVLIVKINGLFEVVSLNDHSTTWDYVVGYGIYLVLAMVNYWLSYRQFCRTQVIGKFVNL